MKPRAGQFAGGEAISKCRCVIASASMNQSISFKTPQGTNATDAQREGIHKAVSRNDVPS